MNRRIPTNLRNKIKDRAGYICEYCLIHEEDAFFGCEVDHIISQKHGGSSEIDNLAYTCPFCNRNKGSDIGSISSKTDNFCRFFNPRKDLWAKHFQLIDEQIQSLTEIGEVTARILQFNALERLLERQELISEGRYPPDAAQPFITN